MKKLINIVVALTMLLSLIAPFRVQVARAASVTKTPAYLPYGWVDFVANGATGAGTNPVVHGKLEGKFIYYTMGDIIYGKGGTPNGQVALVGYGPDGVFGTADDVIVAIAPVANDTYGSFSIATSSVPQDGAYAIRDYTGNTLGGILVSDIYIEYKFNVTPQSLQYCSTQTISGWVLRGDGTGAAYNSSITPAGDQTKPYTTYVHVIYPSGKDVYTSVLANGQFAIAINVNQKGTYKIYVEDNYGDPANPGGSSTEFGFIYAEIPTGALSLKITPIVTPTILYATGLAQSFGVYVTDQDGDAVTGIPATAWTVTGINPGGTVTEAFDGVYIFTVVPSGAGSITVALINYSYFGSSVSASALVTVKAPSAFNPYVSIWGNKNQKYTLGNDNGVCDVVYEKFPCTPGNWIGLTYGVADLGDVDHDSSHLFDYDDMVSDPANFEMYEARAWVSGPVERLSYGSAIPSNNRWIGGKMVQGDGYGLQVTPVNYRYLVTGQGTVTIKIKAKIWQKAVPGGWVDASPADFRGESPNYEKFNACCIEQEQTFTICTIPTCKVNITTPQATKNPTVTIKSVKNGDAEKVGIGGEKVPLATQVTLTVGDKTDLNFAITNDPNNPNINCGCGIIIHLKACGPTAGGDMFTLSNGQKTDEIWYNPYGLGGKPSTTNPADWVTTGGVVTLKGVTVNHAASWYENWYMGMSNVSQGISVEVFGESKPATCGGQPEYKLVYYDPIAIQVNPKTVTMSTKILNSKVTDPKKMVAGVSEVLQMSGFNPDSGIYTVYDEYWDDGNWTNDYYDIASLGGGVYQATISPAFDRAGTFYFDIYAKDGDSMGEATVEVVKPKFDIKLQLSNGNTIDSDGVITEGTVEGIIFTAVDPRDETIELTPTKAWAEPTGVGDAFYGYSFIWGTHKSYPSSDWPVASCGLPTTYVYNANVCGGCSPLKVIALDNPNISDSPQIVVLWQRDGADVVMSLFDVKAPTISVDPNKDIPFYGCPTCGKGTDLVFSAVDAHGQGLADAEVWLTADIAPYTSPVNWTYEIYTGPDGKVTFHFNPPYAGNFKASLTADASKYDWPNQVDTEPDDWMTRPKYGFLNRIMATFTSIYKTPEVDKVAPVVTIDSPADGAEVKTPVVTVTGKVTDNVGVTLLYVGATKVDFAPDGTFSVKVELVEGANTIKVFAFDAAGNKGEKDITVKYTKPVEPKKTVVVLKIGSDIMTVNGKVVQLDAAPEIKDGRTFLPLRAIAEAFGAQVEWNADTQGITVTLGSNTIGLQIGNNTAVVNGNVISIVPPYIKNGRTMVPLRVIAEGLGATVEWDPVNYIVTITMIQQ